MYYRCGRLITKCREHIMGPDDVGHAISVKMGSYLREQRSMAAIVYARGCQETHTVVPAGILRLSEDGSSVRN
jgi:hypothetical protein